MTSLQRVSMATVFVYNTYAPGEAVPSLEGDISNLFYEVRIEKVTTNRPSPTERGEWRVASSPRGIAGERWMRRDGTWHARPEGNGFEYTLDEAFDMAAKAVHPERQPAGRPPAEPILTYPIAADADVDAWYSEEEGTVVYGGGSRQVAMLCRRIRRDAEKLRTMASLVEDAAVQTAVDRKFVETFDAKAKNWIGWLTNPDEQGRQFEIQMQLVEGMTVTQRMHDMATQMERARELAAKLPEATGEAAKVIQELRAALG